MLRKNEKVYEVIAHLLCGFLILAQTLVEITFQGSRGYDIGFKNMVPILKNGRPKIKNFGLLQNGTSGSRHSQYSGQSLGFHRLK